MERKRKGGQGVFGKRWSIVLLLVPLWVQGCTLRSGYDEESQAPSLGDAGRDKKDLVLSDEALALLAKAEDTSLPYRDRIDAVRRLGFLGEKNAVIRLAAMLPGRSDELTFEVVGALGRLADRRALPALRLTQQSPLLPAMSGQWNAQIHLAILGCEKGSPATVDDLGPPRRTFYSPPLPLDKQGLFGVPWRERRKIVFVLDRSGGMIDYMKPLKVELKRCIDTLPPDAEFGIIFLSKDGKALGFAGPALVKPTETTRKAAFEFLDAVRPEEQVSPEEAIRQAFALKPDLLYILTDGGFEENLADFIQLLNKDGRVKVNTLSYIYYSSEVLLRRIARENEGAYAFISAADVRAATNRE